MVVVEISSFIQPKKTSIVAVGIEASGDACHSEGAEIGLYLSCNYRYCSCAHIGKTCVLCVRHILGPGPEYQRETLEQGHAVITHSCENTNSS